jgi:hypothetical protein
VRDTQTQAQTHTETHRQTHAHTHENTFHDTRIHATDAGESFDELVVWVQPAQLPHVVSEHPVNIVYKMIDVHLSHVVPQHPVSGI